MSDTGYRARRRCGNGRGCGRRRSMALSGGMIGRRQILHSRLYSQDGAGGRGRGDEVDVDNRDQNNLFDPGRGLF